MKECFKCKAVKPLEDFYKHPMMADGRVNKCKECNKKDVRENRSDKAEYYREYDKGRANLPKRVLSRKNYQKTENGKYSLEKGRKKYRQNNPIKYAAHILVGNYIRDRKLERKPCEVCGSTYKIHAHHDDYAYPLDVRWLCVAHHSQWHKVNGEAPNAK